MLRLYTSPRGHPLSKTFCSSAFFMKEAQMKLRTLATHGRMSHRPALGFLVAAAIIDLSQKNALTIQAGHLPHAGAKVADAVIGSQEHTCREQDKRFGTFASNGMSASSGGGGGMVQVGGKVNFGHQHIEPTQVNFASVSAAPAGDVFAKSLQ
jgi:hypothetical protein